MGILHSVSTNPKDVHTSNNRLDGDDDLWHSVSANHAANPCSVPVPTNQRRDRRKWGVRQRDAIAILHALSG